MSKRPNSGLEGPESSKRPATGSAGKADAGSGSKSGPEAQVEIKEEIDDDHVEQLPVRVNNNNPPEPLVEIKVEAEQEETPVPASAQPTTTSQLSFKCYLCRDLNFTSAQDLSVHVTAVHNNPSFVCRYCTIRFSNVASIREHQKAIHPNSPPDIPKPYACPDCDEFFIGVRTLKQHHFTHTHNGKRVLCDLCPLTFANFRSLKIHKRDKHNWSKPPRVEPRGPSLKQQKIDPRTLDATSVSPSKLLNFEPQEAPLPLELRLRATLSQSVGQTPKVNPAKVHTCAYCIQSFPTEKALARHQLVHTARRVLCEHCDAHFNRRQALMNHMKKKHPPGSIKPKVALAKPAQANLREAKPAPNQPTYQPRRIPLPVPQRPIIVKSFIGKPKPPPPKVIEPEEDDGEVRPTLTSPTIEGHACPLCSRTYITKKFLARHITTHADDQLWCCERCGSLFTEIEALRGHRREKHGLFTQLTFSNRRMPSKDLVLVPKGEEKAKQATVKLRRATPQPQVVVQPRAQPKPQPQVVVKPRIIKLQPAVQLKPTVQLKLQHKPSVQPIPKLQPKPALQPTPPVQEEVIVKVDPCQVGMVEIKEEPVQEVIEIPDGPEEPPKAPLTVPGLLNILPWRCERCFSRFATMNALKGHRQRAHSLETPVNPSHLIRGQETDIKSALNPLRDHLVNHLTPSRIISKP